MRYLSEAFWAKMEVPYLGAIPFNLVGLAAFALLGFGEPAFWPLGAGLEAAYLLVLSTNPRFRNVIDARGKVAVEQGAEAQRAALLSRLNPSQNHRLEALEAKCQHILQIYQDQQVNEFDSSSFGDLLATVDAMDQTFGPLKESAPGTQTPGEDSSSSSSSGERISQ
jgi:hypothetical protein